MAKIRTRGDIALYALIITGVAVVATGGFVHCVTYWTLPRRAYQFAMVLAIGLPLVIALPVASIALCLVKVITEAVEKIESFVKFDSLTGSLARNYFMEFVRGQLSGGGALLLVDADHFKAVNDTYGHDVGDEALRVLGSTLGFAVPDAGHVGRIGGEEFAIFLPRADPAAAEAAAASINTAMREDGRVIAGKPVGLTVSIGVAMIAPGSTLALLLKEADEALYCAKRDGRDRYVLGNSCNRVDPAALTPAI